MRTSTKVAIAVAVAAEPALAELAPEIAKVLGQAGDGAIVVLMVIGVLQLAKVAAAVQALTMEVSRLDGRVTRLETDD